ncbi:hypothetical protein CI15_12270 [Paraburkholderia monticola]|uniref:Lipoprotein transmembrane n=1 Tax=Paraburkholderia monticola TaxID=1399968 RepID=A0A149PTI4_9BURK|nr:hypothetical protein [Paraburkholderia monticola]KXU88387.1 hypothetical protein CI15_12270 [Paraburkholderia monticola]
MQKPFRSRHFLAVVLVAASLSACGGSDDSPSVATSSTSSTPVTESPSATPPQSSAQVACSPNGSFTYSGSASQVAASNGTLAVVVVPNLPVDVQKNRNFTAPAAPASSQVQQASGAFTTLASSGAATDCLGLDHGMVSDIQGVGSDVAIGRWNQAEDTDGNTYNPGQGVHYAVGTPLALTATSGTLACTQVIADTVASNNGDAMGTLGTTSATLDLGTRTLDNLSMSINLANTNYTLTNAQAPLNGTSTTGQLSIQSVVVGHDATQPLVALGYSATLPNAQAIGGVVVLSCK